MEIAKTDLETAMEAAVEALRERARHAEEDLVERVDEFLEHLNAARVEAESGLGSTLEAQFVVPFGTDVPVLMTAPRLSFPAGGRYIELEPGLGCSGQGVAKAPTLPPGRYRISVAITRVPAPAIVPQCSIEGVTGDCIHADDDECIVGQGGCHFGKLGKLGAKGEDDG